MAQYINKDALVAEIEKRIKEHHSGYLVCLKDILSFIDTLEVKEVDISSVSENLAEAHEYLSYTHTSNLAHNKPMIDAWLKKAMKELFNAGLFKLTHDEKYRMESLGLKSQKGE